MKPNFEHLKAFVPAKDFDYSRRFYAEVFEEGSLTDQLCAFRVGTAEFFLQDFFEPEFARSCTYQVACTDVHAVFEFLSEVVAKYDGPSVRPPKDESWGKVVYLFGPSGELWQFVTARP